MESNTLYIKKRNGNTELFNTKKIYNAIKKAFVANNIYDDVKVKSVTDTAVDKINEHSKGKDIIYIEHVQDIVEIALMESNNIAVAKSFILSVALDISVK